MSMVYTRQTQPLATALQSRLKTYLNQGFIDGVRLMSQTGELGAIVPAWQRLVGEGRFQHLGQDFTLDEHNLRAAQAVRLSPYFNQLSAEQQFILTTACLFHDIAKKAGSLSERVNNQLKSDPMHPARGASVLQGILPGLGYTPDQTRQIVYLVRHHYDIGAAARQLPLSSLYIETLAKTVQNQETLAMLLALTEADIRSIRWDIPGHTVWTASNARNVYQVGQLLRQQLNDTITRTGQRKTLPLPESWLSAVSTY